MDGQAKQPFIIAHVVGKVSIGENVSIWYNAVVRADTNTITIGCDTNIQDNATLHTDAGFPVQIGAGVTVGHNAVVHGCTVGDNTVIGMGSIVLSGAVIGSNCIIGAGSLVTGKCGFLTIPSPLAIPQKLSELSPPRKPTPTEKTQRIM